MSRRNRHHRPPTLPPTPSSPPSPLSPPHTTEDDRAKIGALQRQWMEAVARSDVDAILALITDDAIFLPNHSPAITGKDTIRAMYESIFAHSRVEQRWETEEQVIAGDWAFDRGQEWFIITPRDGSAPPREVGPQRGLTILRRDGQGEWRYARGMGNTAAPLSAPPPPPPPRTR